MAGKKILIVEDDKTVQVLMKSVLEKAGFEVVQAFDAMQGVMMARQSQPDLIILDFMMPAGGGASVLARIRNLAGTSTTPVLLHSAAEEATLNAAIANDPRARVLRKPVPPAQLVEAVNAFLAG